MIADARHHIERAAPGDLPPLFALLDQSGLPREGLGDHVATTLVARQNGTIVGSAALEVYADGALLRSVAVAPEARGSGLGHALTTTAIAMARGFGVPALYLLTTTAERYFPRFGFERIERSAVPSGVQASVEFRSACPETAAVMRKGLASP